MWPSRIQRGMNKESLPGPLLNIKTVLPRYGDSGVKDKTVARTSYLYVLARRCLYIETAPWVFQWGNCKSTLVQVMAWCLTTNKPLSGPMTAQFNESYMCHQASVSHWKCNIPLLVRLEPVQAADLWIHSLALDCIGQRDLHVPGGRFKNTYGLLSLRALKFSPVDKIYIFQCMGKTFCVEFQRYPLKFHTKYLNHTLKDMIFI